MLIYLVLLFSSYLSLMAEISKIVDTKVVTLVTRCPLSYRLSNYNAK